MIRCEVVGRGSIVIRLVHIKGIGLLWVSSGVWWGDNCSVPNFIPSFRLTSLVVVALEWWCLIRFSSGNDNAMEFLSLYVVSDLGWLGGGQWRLDVVGDLASAREEQSGWICLLSWRKVISANGAEMAGVWWSSSALMWSRVGGADGVGFNIPQCCRWMWIRRVNGQQHGRIQPELSGFPCFVDYRWSETGVLGGGSAGIGDSAGRFESEWARPGDSEHVEKFMKIISEKAFFLIIDSKKR